jgi:hypothetical protein
MITQSEFGKMRLKPLCYDSTFLEEVRDIKSESRDITGKMVWSRAKSQPVRDLPQRVVRAKFLDQGTVTEKVRPGRRDRYQ